MVTLGVIDGREEARRLRVEAEREPAIPAFLKGQRGRRYHVHNHVPLEGFDVDPGQIMVVRPTPKQVAGWIAKKRRGRRRVLRDWLLEYGWPLNAHFVEPLLALQPSDPDQDDWPINWPHDVGTAIGLYGNTFAEESGTIFVPCLRRMKKGWGWCCRELLATSSPPLGAFYPLSSEAELGLTRDLAA